jgi:hypothetical protein
VSSGASRRAITSIMETSVCQVIDLMLLQFPSIRAPGVRCFPHASLR